MIVATGRCSSSRAAARRASAALLFCAITTLCAFHAPLATAQLGPWTGGGGGGGRGGAGLDDFAALVDYIEAFSAMSPAQQHAILVTAGLALQTRSGMDCNIFGGPLACRAVPSDSSYIKQCGADAQPKVDCLFREATEANVYDSPVDNLEAYLKQKLAGKDGMMRVDDAPALCPQCFERLQALWCALAVPSCGTFDVLVKKGILPALAQAVKAYRSSSSTTRAEAVSAAVASVLDVAGAGLPCAEMCESVLDTCAGQCQGVGMGGMMGGGANKQATVGQLLQWMASKPEIQQIGRMPNLNNARAVFKDLWDRPLCSLFPRSGQKQAGSMGSCRLPPQTPQCTSQQKWCDAVTMAGKDDSPVMYIQSLILVQLLRASTGWLTTDDAIIWDIHSSVNSAVSTSTDTAFDGMDIGSSSSGKPGMSGGQVAGIVVLSLFGFALLAAGVAMAALRFWRGRASKQVFYHELSDHDIDAGEAFPLNNARDRL